jgi:hypothetical protein
LHAGVAWNINNFAFSFLTVADSAGIGSAQATLNIVHNDSVTIGGSSAKGNQVSLEWKVSGTITLGGTSQDIHQGSVTVDSGPGPTGTVDLNVPDGDLPDGVHFTRTISQLVFLTGEASDFSLNIFSQCTASLSCDADLTGTVELTAILFPDGTTPEQNDFTVEFESGMTIGLPGDFNRNGTVDAADYVSWRKTNNTPVGYNAWFTHFGEASASGGALPAAYGDSLAASSNVPEPDSIAFAALSLLIILHRLRVMRPRRSAKRIQDWRGVGCLLT